MGPLTTVLAVLAATAPGPIEWLGSIENPLRVESFLDPLGDTIGLVYLFVLVVAAASLLLRLRRARGEERQQIKWFAYAASVLGAAHYEGFDVFPPRTREARVGGLDGRQLVLRYD